MKFTELTEAHLEASIENMDKNGILTGFQSADYDVVYKGNRYPPKLVVSGAYQIAHGESIDHNDFSGGKNTPAFRILEKHGFTIEQKPISSKSRNVWLIAPGEGGSMWEEWLDRGYISIDLQVGRLTDFDDVDSIREAISKRYNNLNPINDVKSGTEFLSEMKIGDWVLVKRGRKEILGFGEISSDYSFDALAQSHQHQRSIVWIKTGHWKRDSVGPVKTLTNITKIRVDNSYAWEVHLRMIFEGRIPNFWIFQGNPDVFDFELSLREGGLDSFFVSSHKKSIQIGDFAILWLTGRKSGCYALLEVTADPAVPQGGPSENWIDHGKTGLYCGVKIVASFMDQPILRSTFENEPLFQSFKNGTQGTNFLSTPGQFHFFAQGIFKSNKTRMRKHGQKFWLMHAGDHESGEHGQHWMRYREEAFVSMGPAIKDIHLFDSQEAIIEELQRQGVGSDRNAKPTHTALGFWDFGNEMQIGDIVFIRSYSYFVAVGRITSEYSYDQTDASCPHQRKVEWLELGFTPAPEGWTWKKLTDITAFDGCEGVEFCYERFRRIADQAFMLPDAFPRRVWWVNQDITYDDDQAVLWAPHKTKGDQTRYYHTNVSKVKTGDIIVHYADGAIQGMSRAKSDSYTLKNPYPGEDWGQDGYGAKIDFHSLHVAISKEVLNANLDSVLNRLKPFKGLHPFDKKGGVKQGYLFEFGFHALAEIWLAHRTVIPDWIRPILAGFDTSLPTPSTKTKTMHPLATNRIFYGPPGTGKTYRLQRDLIPKYTTKAGQLSHEEWIDQLASEATWIEAITVAMLDLEKAVMKDVLKHDFMQAKARVSNSKNPQNTVWGIIQQHVSEECDLVRVKKRREPALFWKEKVAEQSLFSFARDIDDFDLDRAQYFRTQLETGPHQKMMEDIHHFEFVTFHQSFSYEDFVEGIKPVFGDESEQQLSYQIESGVFKRVCNRARNNPNQKFAIFIDEINRGNVASIFGELITLIEPDKREGQKNALSVKLPYSKELFSVPSNLDIYGTMNTADRSVEALDTALRRRFEFEEVSPDPELLKGIIIDGIDLEHLLKAINSRIEHLLDRDHCIGHSYFIKLDANSSLLAIQEVFSQNILPLLQEYFYGDYGKVGLVLGEQFVNRTQSNDLVFAPFDHPDVDLLREKEMYVLRDPMGVSAEGFRSIYQRSDA